MTFDFNTILQIVTLIVAGFGLYMGLFVKTAVVEAKLEFETKFSEIKTEIANIKTDIANVKTEVEAKFGEIKTEIGNLKCDIGFLKGKLDR